MREVDLIADIPMPAAVREEGSHLLGEYGRQVRTEPGNLRFESYVAEDTGDLVVIERYRDQAAVRDHLGRPDSAAFNAWLAVLADCA